MILCNPEESDGMETSPGHACQGFVHIWKCSAEKLKLHKLSPHFFLREN